MASTLPVSTADDDVRRSSSSSRREGYSHGRGGAGNIGPANDVTHEDLTTPTIKSSVYTTGRGGSGNMAKNTDPEEARKAQDVVSIPHREVETSTHVGRGGAANVFQPSQDEIAVARAENDRLLAAEAKVKNGEMGLADKGKAWLFGRKG